jgi:signal recognition particle GTPase
MMKMGPIGKVMQMIPGLGNMLPQVNGVCIASPFAECSGLTAAAGC